MTNQVYDWVRDELWSDQFEPSLEEWTLYAMITGAYTFAAGETTITFAASDYTASETATFGTIGASGTGILKLNTVTYTGISTGDEVDSCVLSMQARLFAEERPFAYFDDASGLPITFDGGDRVVSGITIKILNKA